MSSRRKRRWWIRRRFLFIAACSFCLILCFGANAEGLGSAEQPRAAAGEWDPLANGLWLLRDPVSKAPAALFEDPTGQVAGPGAGVLEADARETGGYALLTVRDRRPEFWAQPSVWNGFQRGPSAYAGLGRDAGASDWAGRPEFDRRAYALDPGWRSLQDLAPPTPPKPGRVGVVLGGRSLGLQWHALPGHVYVIERTSSLSQSFQTFQTFGSVSEQDMLVPLPLDSAAGFFRLADVVY